VSTRALRWVVTDDDPSTLAGLLLRLGGAAEGALEQGRVFVDGRRANDPTLHLQTGQVVSLEAPRRGQGADRVRILDERDGLLAAYKPAALSTEPDRRGNDSLTSRVAALRKLALSEVHALSRLDHGVSGVVLLAIDAAARRHATLAREQGKILRRYVAIAQGAPAEPRGIWKTPVGDRGASTRFACVESASGCTLLALEPITGRMHQLRVHASRAGAPLLGDNRYGGPRRRVLTDGSVIELGQIALHAATVSMPDPSGHAWRVEALVADDLLLLWEQIGGTRDAWTEALNDELFGAIE
jgi:23S rRNA-/tRNA-specific pseudouridylate synthase